LSGLPGQEKSQSRQVMYELASFPHTFQLALIFNATQGSYYSCILKDFTLKLIKERGNKV